MANWLPLAAIGARTVPDRVVARGDGCALDHAAFRARVAGWRSAFAAHPGHRFALYFEDSAAFAAALFGAWHAGKAVCLCGDNLPVTIERLRVQVDGFAGDLPEALLPIAEADVAEWPQLDEAATVVSLYTSGSSGEPVALHKRLDQLAREVEALEASFGEALDNAVVHGTVSHQHIYGLLFRVLWPLAAGRAIGVRRFFLEQLIPALAHQPSALITSPAHLSRLPKTLDWTPVQPMLRAVFSSGGALAAEAAVAVREQIGTAPTEIYGSSETGGIAWRRWDAVAPSWQPLPGVAWRVVDDQLEVASPHLPSDAWWRTEDRAEADGRGGFRLLGRADRIVKIEERRVSLTALERQLAALDDVVEARVLAMPGARTELAAVVVPSAIGRERLQRLGKRAFAQTLQASLEQAQDAVMRPRRWRFVEALPINTQGKITQAALQALFRPARPEQPTWIRREALQVEMELELSSDLAVFDGHFPQVAILPGVAQLDWAVRYGREAFALPPYFLRLEALKFQRVARPGARLRLHLEWLPHKQTLSFRYESEIGAHASGRVVFAEATA